MEILWIHVPSTDASDASPSEWERDRYKRVYLYTDRLYFNHLLIFRLVCVPRRCLLCIFMRHATKKNSHEHFSFLREVLFIDFTLYRGFAYHFQCNRRSLYTLYACTIYIRLPGKGERQRGAGKGDRDCDRLARNFVSAFNQFTYRQVWYVCRYLYRNIFIYTSHMRRRVESSTHLPFIALCIRKYVFIFMRILFLDLCNFYTISIISILTH